MEPTPEQSQAIANLGTLPAFHAVFDHLTLMGLTDPADIMALPTDRETIVALWQIQDDMDPHAAQTIKVKINLIKIRIQAILNPPAAAEAPALAAPAPAPAAPAPARLQHHQRYSSCLRRSRRTPWRKSRTRTRGWPAQRCSCSRRVWDTCSAKQSYARS